MQNDTKLSAPSKVPKAPTTTLPKPANSADSAISQATEPLDPGKIMDRLDHTIRSFVVIDEAQLVAAVLWIVMTHFIGVIQVAPIALITAPEKACGKSQLLTLFDYFVANAMSVANSTASFIFRCIEAYSPTLLIDEADTFLKENGELKGIINAGHTRTQAYVGRTESDGNGGFIPKRFLVWCAKALAGIALERHLPPATLSRSIKISLRRKMAHESVSRLRHADRAEFEALAAQLVEMGKVYAERIRQARPALPDELSDRAQDNWESLIAIAELGGPVWRDRAVAAALKLSKSEEESVSFGNELLADIRQTFAERKADKLSTAMLIEALTEDSEGPWATYNRGKQITPRQLAKLLLSYDPGLKSKTVRLGAHDTPKGYDLAQFNDVFARYLTPSAAVVEDATEPEATPVSTTASQSADRPETAF